MALRVIVTGLQGAAATLSRGLADEVLAVMPRSEAAPEGSGGPLAWPITFLPRTVVECSDLGIHEWDPAPGAVAEVLAACPSLTPPGPEHARIISETARRAVAAGRVLGDAGTWRLLVHCNAGVSRSVAAAYAVLCVRVGPGREGAAFAELGELVGSPPPLPCPLLTRLLDAELGLGGRMVAAARRSSEGMPADGNGSLAA